MHIIFYQQAMLKKLTKACDAINPKGETWWTFTPETPFSIDTLTIFTRP